MHSEANVNACLLFIDEKGIQIHVCTGKKKLKQATQIKHTSDPQAKYKHTQTNTHTHTELIIYLHVKIHVIHTKARVKIQYWSLLN